LKPEGWTLRGFIDEVRNQGQLPNYYYQVTPTSSLKEQKLCKLPTSQVSFIGTLSHPYQAPAPRQRAKN
jgi:hypothetical protein